MKWSNFTLATIGLLTLSASLSAQTAQPKSSSTDKVQTRQVIASASGNSVRFSALGEMIQLRLEVIGSSGEVLYDSNFKSGNVIDWPGSDTTGRPLADGAYLCVVSIKDLSGQITRKRAIAGLHNQVVGLKQSDSSLLSAAQAQAGGEDSGDDVSLTILEPGQTSATAVIAHDGGQAHLVSGSGGLSISSGDFFANKVIEHMRLTAEGNVGIGISNPQAKLDVGGRIRTGEGIVFPDGSVQFSASRKTFGAASLRPGQSQQVQGQDAALFPDTSGTGTTGKIPVWLNGPSGVLGDSNITELDGSIGINAPPNPIFRLDVNGYMRFRGSNPSFYMSGLHAGGNDWVFQTVDDDGRFRIFGGLERLTISLSTGNVGIGVFPSTSRLDVAGNINTSTQYNIAGSRILGIGGNQNTFAGIGAGASSTALAENNTYFGSSAGQNSTTTGGNSFFGAASGRLNTSGGSNSFFGNNTGEHNTTGESNAFFGVNAGRENTTADDNSFFGRSAGGSNMTGTQNSSFGTRAGLDGVTGNNNSFFGFEAGRKNTASGNSFFGSDSGKANTTGSGNSFFGLSTGLNNVNGSDNSFFGVNTGRSNTSGIRNSFFGRLAGNSNTTSDNNSFFGYSAGLQNTADGNSFFGSQSGFSNITGTGNSFFGLSSGQENEDGSDNAFFGVNTGRANRASRNSYFGRLAGRNTSTGHDNTFVGYNSGENNRSGNNNTFLGADTKFDSDFATYNFATAIGAGALATASNTIVLGRPSDDVVVSGELTILGRRIELGFSNQTLDIDGQVKLFLGGQGDTDVCFNTNRVLGLCGSSLRYKTYVNPFTSGLSLIRRLRPVSFDWKSSNKADIGLIAEEVNEVEPLLVIRNDRGEIEGVKYKQLGVVLVNAVNELKAEKDAQISALKSQSEVWQKQLTALKTENAALRRQNSAMDTRLTALELKIKIKPARHKASNGRARKTSTHPSS